MAYTTKAYKEGDRVTQLRQTMVKTQEQRPEYASRYGGELDEALGKLRSRGPFTYDPQTDPMYHTYRDLYVRGGQRAMEDTMGKAAALTGGYGSSYSQQAGQQTYNAWLQGLGDKAGELYGLALDTYTREGEALKDGYKLLAEQEDRDYSRYLDSLNGWLQERQYQTDLYTKERDFDYGLSRDQEADRQWQAEQALAEKKLGLQTGKSGSGSKSSSGKSSSGSSGGSGKSGSGKSGGSTSSGDGGEDAHAGLIETLEWVKDSGSGENVKRRQMETVVSEAVARGEITDDEGKALLSRYTAKVSTGGSDAVRSTAAKPAAMAAMQ